MQRGADTNIPENDPAPAPGGHIQRRVAVILYITRIGATTWTGASAGSVGRGRWMQRPISRRHHQIEDLRVTA